MARHDEKPGLRQHLGREHGEDVFELQPPIYKSVETPTNSNRRLIIAKSPHATTRFQPDIANQSSQNRSQTRQHPSAFAFYLHKNPSASTALQYSLRSRDSIYSDLLLDRITTGASDPENRSQDTFHAVVSIREHPQADQRQVAAAQTHMLSISIPSLNTQELYA